MSKAIERLQQLLSITDKEAYHLEQVASRLQQKLPGTTEQLEQAFSKPELIDTLESFTAKFARLQDTLADKLLPAFLIAAGEKPGTAIENLNRAEKLSLIDNTQNWLIARSLRNKLVHEYIENYSELIESIKLAQEFTKKLLTAQKAFKNYCSQNLNINPL